MPADVDQALPADDLSKADRKNRLEEEGKVLLDGVRACAKNILAEELSKKAEKKKKLKDLNDQRPQVSLAEWISEMLQRSPEFPER